MDWERVNVLLDVLEGARQYPMELKALHDAAMSELRKMQEEIGKVPKPPEPSSEIIQSNETNGNGTRRL